MVQPAPADAHKRSVAGIPDLNRRTCAPKGSVWRRCLPTAGQPGVAGIGWALYLTAGRRTDRRISAALLSRPAELHQDKGLSFQVLAGWEQREWFSFISIFSPPSTLFTNLSPEPLNGTFFFCTLFGSPALLTLVANHF